MVFCVCVLQEDVITLSSHTTQTATAPGAAAGAAGAGAGADAGGRHDGERVCLAAEGFGNRMCFLQSMANKVRSFDF